RHVLIGICCGLIAGLGFGLAAAVQKREAVQVAVPLRKLVPTLASRAPWLLAVGGSIVAWIAQVVAFAKAPIAVVMPFLSLGTAPAFAAGIVFVVTSLLSKEVGDRFAAEGSHAVLALLGSPTPWLLAAAAFVGTTFEQRGFQRANAASVSAVTSAVDIGGTVAA